MVWTGGTSNVTIIEEGCRVGRQGTGTHVEGRMRECGHHRVTVHRVRGPRPRPDFHQPELRRPDADPVIGVWIPAGCGRIPAPIRYDNNKIWSDYCSPT